MAANSGGIAGRQTLRTQIKPLYLHAFTACLALAAMKMLEIVGMRAWYFLSLSNRRLAKEAVEAPIIKGTTEVTADGHRGPSSGPGGGSGVSTLGILSAYDLEYAVLRGCSYVHMRSNWKRLPLTAALSL